MACIFTKAYLLTTIRALLNEKSSIKWTDEQINKWIQEAAIDISTKTLGYEQTYTFWTQKDILEYDEPESCVKVHACVAVSPGFLLKEDGDFILSESGDKIIL